MVDKEKRRKCFKCGLSPSVDPSVQLFRFPKPGIRNLLRCALWAKYCLPNREWHSTEFQDKLYSEHRMLCNRHFKNTSFGDHPYSHTKLQRLAVPEDEESVEVQKNALPSITPQCNTTNIQRSPVSPKDPLAIDEEILERISLGDEEENPSINIADDILSFPELEYLEETLEDDELEQTTNIISQEEGIIDADTEIDISTQIGEEILGELDTEPVDGESDNPQISIKDFICATCFSYGRTLYKLMENRNFVLIQQLCSEIQFTEEDKICWECDAAVHNMKKFKQKALTAQSLFKDVCEEQITTQSLSRLKTTEMCHLSISLSESLVETNSNVDDFEIDKENDTNILDGIWEDDYTQPALSSPLHDHPYARSDDGKGENFGNDSTSTPQNNKPLSSRNEENTKKRERHHYGSKLKYMFNVKHISVIQDQLKVSTQPQLVKVVCKQKKLSEEELVKLRENRRNNWFRNSEYKCDTCIEKFKIADELVKHNKKHDLAAGEFVCKICELRFADKATCEEHYKNHFIVFECVACGFQTERRNTMLRHFERKHHERRRVCRDCGQVFMLFREFSRHRLMAHGPKLTCKSCGKIFREKNTFAVHLRTHKNRLPSTACKCRVCDAMVRGPKSLVRHMLEVHNIKEEEKYCSICKVRFKSWGSLYYHCVSLKHARNANLSMENVMRQCEDCGKFFTNACQLNIHRRQFHVYEKSTCELCNKDFISKALLLLHLRTSKRHKTDRVRDQVCELCGKSFYDVRSLKKHLYSHSTTRPYVCDICGSAFTSPHGLYKHRRKVHKIGGVNWKKFFSDSAFPFGGLSEV